jgi:hypothetical protein
MTSAIYGPIQSIAQTHRNHGLRATVGWLSSRLGEKVLRLEVSQLLWLDVAKLPACVQGGTDFTFRFLSPVEITRAGEDARLGIEKGFIDRATRRGDLCFGVFHGERLVSFSWYAKNCVEAEDHVGVAMSFPSDTSYMFNAFTDPEFRGRQLFSLGVALASKELAGQGIARVITTVNRSNFASLRSCGRLGFVVLGQIWTVGRGKRRFALTPSAAGELGIRFGDC